MSHVPVLMMVAALAQTPAQTGRLDLVPPEADVAVRISGMKSVQADLVAMLKAMSPKLGEQAQPAIEQGVNQFAAQFGEQAAIQPFVVVIRAVAPENPASPPFAVIVSSENPDGVLGSLTGGNPLKLKKEDGGYDSFEGPQAATWYAARSAGRVAFGPDKALIAGIAKMGDKSVGKTVSKTDRDRFDRGDVAVYVNLNAIVGRYGVQIDQAKQSLLAVMDQAGGQLGNAGMVEGIKKMYGGMFDGTKQTDSLTFNIDFAGEGLTVDGALNVKPDSPAAKLVGAAKSGDASALGKIPAAAAYHVYMNMDGKSYDQLVRLGLSFMSGGGAQSAEMKAAVEKLHAAGSVETIGGMTMASGMKAINVTNTADPKALLEMQLLTFKAMKDSGGPVNFFKEVVVTPNAQEYRGFTFTRVDMTVDKEKLAKLQPGNPAAGDAVLRMYGGETISTWLGIDDKQLVQVTAKSQDEAKQIFDKYSEGEDSIGATEAFKAARAKLPKQVNLLMLMSAQGLLGQIATQFGAKLGDLPQEPALMGGSVTMTAPSAVEFRFILPSTAGPVFEKGLAPLLQGLRPGGND